jgi:hypothetical protein
LKVRIIVEASGLNWICADSLTTEQQIEVVKNSTKRFLTLKYLHIISILGVTLAWKCIFCFSTVI